MADTNKQKKTPATGGRRPAAKGQGTVTATAASKAPAKSKAGTNTVRSAAKKPAKSKDDGQQTAKIKRRSTFSEQFLPYIFGALALMFAVFLVLNVLDGADAPKTHAGGVIGYYVCRILFGCLGWSAYLLPLCFLYLAIFWRRYCEERLVAVKVILSVLLMVLISAVIHVGVCASNTNLSQVYDVGHLFRTGAVFESGGVIGGLAGYALYAGLKLPGTIALAVVVLPLIFMLLIGVTPAYVFGKIKTAVKVRREVAAEDREIRREEKAARREEEDAAAEAKRRADLTESYRKKREKAADAQRRAEIAHDDPNFAEDEELEPVEESAPKSKQKSARKSGRRTALVDTETGEMLEEEASAAPAAPAQTATPDDEDEDQPVLPLFESAATEKAGPTPKEEKRYEGAELDWKDAPEDRDSGYVAKKFNTKNTRPAPAPARRELVDDGETEDYDTTDAMYTDLDEEASLPFSDPTDESDADEVSMTAAETAPTRGGYSVVYQADAKPADGLMVTINKQEYSAVAESGLSEEELVLSSAHDPAELPAEPTREYQFPSVDMLTKGSSRYEANDEEIAENTRLLREVLESFHIRVKEISCSCGPTITRFEVKPDTGVRVRAIANLVDDIAMNLAKAGVRIEAPIPGKAAVGIEVPNAEPSTVYLRNILETPEFRNHKSRIAACLGADVSGRPVILDINKMPHLLIAGATGMGKSVCINSIVMSILYKAKPDEVKLILIDPKKVEFAMYRELPHLLCPIVSDPKQAAGTLYCAVNEMERRFGLIEEVGVRNLAGYNEITAGDPERPAMPQIVIIIDELADLMMTAPADVETAICRLAQKARAAGIHLVIGTQRPSVDVITGLIKANIPSRIAFTVASAVDSRTIIDTVGADKLIGRGDMLYAPVGVNKPMRCQGTFVSESEVERAVTFIKENNDPVVYDEEFIKNIAVEAARCGVNKKKGEQVSIDDFDGLGGEGQNLWGEEPKFWEALEVIVSKEKFGTSALQRALHLGYGKAASIIDRMEEYGFVGPDPGNKTGRDVRITHEQLRDYKENGLPGHRKDSGDDLFED